MIEGAINRDQFERGYGGTARTIRGWLVRAARPRSTLSLLCGALLIVILPLLVAISVAIYQVDKLAAQSNIAVIDAQIQTQSRRALFEHLSSMERAALQFSVLSESVIFNSYQESRDIFTAAVRALAQEPDATLLTASERVLELELRLFDTVRNKPRGSELKEDIAAQFSGLRAAAEVLSTLSIRHLWRAASAVSEDASTVNSRLLWLAAISVPTTGALIVLFSLLIHRPLKQIGSAIRALGTGPLTSPIKVRGGSSDLEELGEHLDWLRLQLAEQDAARTSFLRHISHELKTPLSAIREGADLLCEQRMVSIAGNEERIQIAQIVRGNSVTLQRLIENLLRRSAGSPSTREMSLVRVALKKVIGRVLRDHKLVIDSKQLAIRQQLGGVAVLGDFEALRVVFDNLVSNAVRFAPNGSRVTVTAFYEASRTVVTVQDEGPGIDKAEQFRVFEPFFQGPQQPQGAVKGTGLGLSIARELICAQGGSIEIVDVPRGTSLRVVLPANNATGADSNV